MIEDAAREFQGGPEQALVTIVKSQLALKRGEVDTALALLRRVLYLPCLIDRLCHKQLLNTGLHLGQHVWSVVCCCMSFMSYTDMQPSCWRPYSLALLVLLTVCPQAICNINFCVIS